MCVVADHRRANAEVLQQLLCFAGILARDAIGKFEHTEGTQRDVFQVADGSRDQVQAGCQLHARGAVRLR